MLSKVTRFHQLKFLVNDQIIGAKKDLCKQKGKGQQVTIFSALNKMTVEDIYSFIKNAYNRVKSDGEFIRNSFKLAGYVLLEELDPNLNRESIADRVKRQKKL